MEGELGHIFKQRTQQNFTILNPITKEINEEGSGLLAPTPLYPCLRHFYGCISTWTRAHGLNAGTVESVKRAKF